MKRKRKNEWYRRPKEEIVLEHLFTDGKSTVSIIESIVGETPWRIKPSEKVDKLIKCAEELGLNYLGSNQSFNQIPGIKTKEKQFEEYALEEFRRAIFHECGKQQYL